MAFKNVHNSKLVNSHIKASHTHKQYHIFLANIARQSKLHISSIAFFCLSIFLVLEMSLIFTEKVNGSLFKKCLLYYREPVSEVQA